MCGRGSENPVRAQVGRSRTGILVAHVAEPGAPATDAVDARCFPPHALSATVTARVASRAANKRICPFYNAAGRTVPASTLRRMHVANLDDLDSFITLDGSQIRELAGPSWTPARNQSLAEATVPVGEATTAHYHRTTEELYYIVSGEGRMRVAEEERDVRRGDCIVIPPGAEHKLTNTGGEPLVLLCCCAPAYSDEDTVLTESA
jgi:mannose-6-phosphate isomerase-like protein (cupin superfamily)